MIYSVRNGVVNANAATMASLWDAAILILGFFRAKRVDGAPIRIRALVLSTAALMASRVACCRSASLLGRFAANDALALVVTVGFWVAAVVVTGSSVGSVISSATQECCLDTARSISTIQVSAALGFVTATFIVS